MSVSESNARNPNARFPSGSAMLPDAKRRMNPSEEDDVAASIRDLGEFEHKDIRSNCLKQISQILYDEMNIVQVAKRYEQIIYQNSRSMSEYADSAVLRDRVRYLLHSDSPRTLAADLLSLKPKQDASPTIDRSFFYPLPTKDDRFENCTSPTEEGVRHSTKVDVISPCLNHSDAETEDLSTSTGRDNEDRFFAKAASIHTNDANIGQSSKRLRKIPQGTWIKPGSMNRKGQRLWELYHSAKCLHDERTGPCPSSVHCNSMKRLWYHIETCVDDSCRESHCYSSRSILAHHQYCTWETCPICNTVRNQVKTSNLNLQRISRFNQLGHDARDRHTNVDEPIGQRIAATTDASTPACTSYSQPPYQYCNYVNEQSSDTTKLSPIAERDNSLSPSNSTARLD